MQNSTGQPIPELIKTFFTRYFLFVLIALFAGMARWAEGEDHSTFQLFKNVLVSGFSGMLALCITQSIPMNTWMRGFVVGVCAHMGERIMAYFEKKARAWMEA